jgi:ATP phosphoribosyltransferase
MTMSENRTLRLAIPNGNLQAAALDLFNRAGYKMSVGSRSYFPNVDDKEIEAMLMRPQEMPRYAQDGLIDAGFTGGDLIVETGAQVVEVLDMGGSKLDGFHTRWVIAVLNGSPIKEARDLEGKRIATELINVTKSYLESRGIAAHVEYSYGATEVKPPAGLADAIIESTVTGNSLRANGLRIVDTVFESTPRFIASPQAWADPWKRQKIEDIALMLRGAIAAEGKVWLAMNVRKADLDSVLAILPALDKPTISSLSDPEWVDVTTIVDEDGVHQIAPRLKQAGAHGIVEYPLNKIID